MSVSSDGLSGRPTTGWCRVSFRTVKLPRYAHLRACSRLEACSHRVVDAASGTLSVTVRLAQRHMCVSPDGLSGRPTTGWCRVSFRTVKLPRYAHLRACSRLEACSHRVVDAASGTLSVTVRLARRHMCVSPDRLRGRATTGWCRVSFRRVKLPR